jgi:NAD(P)-dependent dehydrogenase (short-subunit alcohol dehydrogenase family)
MAPLSTTYEHFGHVNILVNNAGMSPLAPSSAETSEELFDKVVGVNFKGPFRLSARIGQRMYEGDGGNVQVDGDAPLDVDIRFAIPEGRMGEMTPGYTANRAVNAVPYVCAAPPGIRTTVDLPQIIPALGSS